MADRSDVRQCWAATISQANMNNETNSQLLQAQSKQVYCLYQDVP